MRKIFCIFLILSCLISTIVFAYCDSSSTEAFTPTHTIEELYVFSDSSFVDIIENSKFDYISMLKGSFSEKIIECVPLTFNSLNEEYRSERFNMAHPNIDLWAYDCFIVDADGNILGNVTCKYLECPYGEWWYDVFVTMAPGKYTSEQIAYLVWVEE